MPRRNYSSWASLYSSSSSLEESSFHFLRSSSKNLAYRSILSASMRICRAVTRTTSLGSTSFFQDDTFFTSFVLLLLLLQEPFPQLPDHPGVVLFRLLLLQPAVTRQIFQDLLLIHPSPFGS